MELTPQLALAGLRGSAAGWDTGRTLQYG